MSQEVALGVPLQQKSAVTRREEAGVDVNYCVEAERRLKKELLHFAKHADVLNGGIIGLSPSSVGASGAVVVSAAFSERPAGLVVGPSARHPYLEIRAPTPEFLSRLSRPSSRLSS